MQSRWYIITNFIEESKKIIINNASASTKSNQGFLSNIYIYISLVVTLRSTCHNGVIISLLHTNT